MTERLRFDAGALARMASRSNMSWADSLADYRRTRDPRHYCDAHRSYGYACAYWTAALYLVGARVAAKPAYVDQEGGADG